MRTYIIRRLLLVIPTLLIVTIIVFFSIRLVPGNVVEMMAVEQEFISGKGFEAIMHDLGLDMPLHIQYGRWMAGIFRGDFGDSLWSFRPVTEIVFEKIPISFELGLLAMIVALLIACPIGIYSAIRQDTAGDYIGRIVAILCICVPSFWLGTMVMVFPAIWWNWSPSMRYIPFIEDPLGNLGMFIIPAAILGMVLSGVTMRMTRTMMLEVLRQDYIRTAWSKGLSERTIIMRHALRNALIPVVSMIGLMLPLVIAGAVVIEQIFCLPGIGLLMLEALNKRDYPIVSGINLLLAFAVLLSNLLVDISYAYLDPRVQYK